MVTEDNWLDLFNLIFNEFIGDFFLGIVICIVVLTIYLINQNQSYEIILLSNSLFLCVVFAYNTGALILWIITVLLAGVLFYYAISKKVEE